MSSRPCSKHLYQRLYCARGQAENHVKAWKNRLAADALLGTRPRPTSFVSSCLAGQPLRNLVDKARWL
jgi:hypothetical protein